MENCVPASDIGNGTPQSSRGALLCTRTAEAVAEKNKEGIVLLCDFAPLRWAVAGLSEKSL
jgi:hypothetical protein